MSAEHDQVDALARRIVKDLADVKGDLRTLNAGLEGNVGVTYRFGHNGITLQGGANYGFVNVQRDAVNGRNGTGAATIVAGYTRWLGRQGARGGVSDRRCPMPSW
jgi:hypothetical protein